MNSVPASRPKILLVEDDDAVRRSLQLLLGAHGYQVMAYPSAVGLAEDPNALLAACLIADLIMPQTSAIDLLNELHTAGWMGKAIMISGHLDDDWEERARAAGFNAVMAKPTSDSALVRAVQELLPSASAA